MARISEETRDRAARHGLEIFVVLTATVLFGRFGVFPDEVPDWLVPGVFVLGAATIVLAYTAWGASTDSRDISRRVGAQTGVLACITYATGWGFALPLVHLFAVADNVKYSGSRTVVTVARWAVAWTVVGQLALQFGLAPSVHRPYLDTWAISLFMMMAVVAVAARIRQMAVAREEAQDELRDSEARFRSLVEDASDVVLLVREGAVTYQSPSVQRVLGYGPDEVVGAPYLSFVHADDRDQTIEGVIGLLEDPDLPRLIDCRLRHKDGHWVQVETSARNLMADHRVGAFVLNMRDVTERKRLEEELEHRAFHDGLTGLPNRSLFRDRVEHVVVRAARKKSLQPGVLYLDLDGFKVVNDTLGHAAGDDVLKTVAERIQLAIRDSDTAARLGGDEFAVLLEDLDDDEGAARVAQRIIDAMAAPICARGIDISIGVSVGIALLRDGWSGEELLRNADIAMYMAKASGKGCFEVFEVEMHATVVQRLELERDLQLGLERDEFVVHYQPIVELVDSRIVGVEALVRWDRGTAGMVSPADFIPVAEETGLIIPLGRWVLREACTQAVKWQTMAGGAPALHISVNVSMKQLAHPDLVADVRQILEETGIDPASVVLELTETALVHDTEHTAQVLTQLKSLGVRLAIDDFGTGYSSLAYLQRFPLDILKIDRSFVEGVVRGTQSPALVRAIIDMSRSLDLETVAEGIEHLEELQRVRAMRCSLGQGYLFARPAPADEITERICVVGAAVSERSRV